MTCDFLTTMQSPGVQISADIIVTRIPVTIYVCGFIFTANNTSKVRIEDSQKPKIVPTFGKKAKTNISISSKPKKFVPPVKKINDEDGNSKSLTNDDHIQQPFLPHFKQTFGDSKVKSSGIDHLQSLTLNDYDFGSECRNESYVSNVTSQTASINRDNSFTGLLTGCFDVLNDESIMLSQNSVNNPHIDLSNSLGNNYIDYANNHSGHNENTINTFNASRNSDMANSLDINITDYINNGNKHIKNINSVQNQEDGSRNIDTGNTEVTMLAQSRMPSQVSVASLKIYRDMDSKSFERKPLHHKVLHGEQFFKLFKEVEVKNIKEPVGMSLINGDMGFKTFYSEFVKNFHIDEEETNEAKDTLEKLLQMYPIENEKLISMRKGKK